MLNLTAWIGLLSSLTCHIYVTYFLRVNKINKLLLRAYAGELILGFFAIIVGHMLLPFVQNIWTCLLSLTPTKVLSYLVTHTSMCISGIRYYTKIKAEKSEIVNPKHVITFIKWSKFVSYFIQLIQNILCFWYQIDVDFVLCANIHFYEKKSYKIQFIPVLVYHVPLMLQILLAIVFELKSKQLQGYS